MEIKYNLTTGNLYRANLLLTLYRSFKPIIIFTIIFLAYTLYSGALAAFIYGVPLGLISGIAISLIMGLILARRNKHYEGKRTLILNKDSYQYIGESFTRETKWSSKIKNWFTPWYIFLDITSLYPVVIKRDAISENDANQIRDLLKR
jgi:hypothetical protein